MSELTRRDLLVRGTAAAAAAYALRGPASGLIPGTAHAQTPPADAWNHAPASPIGPLHWGDIDGFSVCGTGKHQSPVNIDTAHVEAGHGPPLSLKYKRSELAINNTGHAIEVPIPAGVEDVLQLGGDRYQLTQYHFHALSEHTVNGRHADVEGHFVHKNANGDTAVVGVFYRLGHRPNALLDRILLNTPETSGEEVDTGDEPTPAQLFSHLEGARMRRGDVRVDSSTPTTVHSRPRDAPRTCVGRRSPTAAMSRERPCRASTGSSRSSPTTSGMRATIARYSH